MKRTITITDLTRMQEGRVCIAGYDEEGNCIRPVLPPPGIHERTLYSQGHPIIFPFALVEYYLLHPHPQPPHTEDYRYNPNTVKLIGQLDEDRKRILLEKTLYKSVKAIFEVPIHSDVGFYVMDGEGPRSLGTNKPRKIIKAIYEQDTEGKWRYRLGFIDGDEETFWLTVTDLAWRYYCDHRCREGDDLREISSHLSSFLKSASVYLRIGLARGWEKFPDRCFIQITGVYSFPDYLEGRIFADFAPT
jgi:hypothetical protein